ncbi:MAG: prepilin peptidase, partial [Verrucomicrobiaceae bacterium]
MNRQQFLDYLLHVLVFLMGAGIGSFLNVVIYRLPRGISVNNPRRSFCFSCKKQIPWYHNLPLISWLVLRGKCANCGSRIAFRYFFVELLTAYLFYAVFRKFGADWELIRIWGPVMLIFWVFTALLVSGTFIDIDHFILPHVVTLGGLGVGLIASFWKPMEMMGETAHWRGLLIS